MYRRVEDRLPCVIKPFFWQAAYDRDTAGVDKVLYTVFFMLTAYLLQNSLRQHHTLQIL